MILSCAKIRSFLLDSLAFPSGLAGAPPGMAYASPYVLSFLLLLSIPAVYFLAPRLLLPKTLPAIPDADETEDLALFRRAVLLSAAPSAPGAPSAGVFGRRPQAQPKVAFLFLTNSDLVFAPLWEKFFAGHHGLLNLYVHADPSANLTLPPTPSFRGRIIRGKATARASATLISAARRLLATALLDDPANQFFALLSQSCVPLLPFPALYRTLVTDNNAGAGRHRHRSFIEILDSEPTLHARYYARGDNVMLPEVPFDRFRVGSQFFVLARRHAVMVVRDRRLWNKFKSPCLVKEKDSCYPEEHYFPTLLDMQDPDGCTKYTLTRVNWTDAVEGHPHTYQPEEVSGELIRELRKSNGTYSHMFARKFAPETLAPLMEIADSVILRD